MLIRRHSQSRSRHNSPQVVPLDRHRRAILRMLQGSHNLSLVAPAGTGSTRLLKEIAEVRKRQPAGLPVLLYLDCSRLKDATERQLFAVMLQAVRDEIPDLVPRGRARAWQMPGDAYAPLVAALDACEERGARVCYLFDHFDELVRSQHLNASVFSALRSICSRPDMSFVCATPRPLPELPGITARYGSPLWNVFMVHQLGREGLPPGAVARGSRAEGSISGP